MIEESGVVIAVRDDLADVESRRRSVCGGCSANSACGTSLLERFFGRKQLLLTVRNPIGAEPGDEVIVGVPEAALLQASVAAYVVPLLAMIGGGIGGDFLAALLAPAYAQGLSVLGGIGGLAAGLLWLRRFNSTREADERFRPVILRRSGAGAFPIRTSH
ncbi:MAG: SoxR reducing system RseC family protein [Pseudomonadota bacterium]|nr:SoxR reducing system RseC family protein [Pseudomonadota bacterium]